MRYIATLDRRRWAIGVLLLAMFGLGWTLRGGDSAGTMGAGRDHAPRLDEPAVWTCSMHPAVQLPQAGQCPICFMDLIPLRQKQSNGLGPRDLTMSASAAALAEIRTEPVQRMFVTKPVRLVGEVTYDETRTRSITARVSGRLEKLYVDFTGQTVRPGEKLALIYSPELYAAQAELQAALQGVAAGGVGGADWRPGAEATLAAVRDRLRLWGLDDDQIAALETSDAIAEKLTIRSPLGGVVVSKAAVVGAYVGVGSPLYTVADLSRVWVALEAYESDLPWLRPGQRVVFTVPALAGREFAGDIVFIDPILDESTRTVAVRIEVDNRDDTLKPGMLVHAVAAVTLDAAGRPLDRSPAVERRTTDIATGESGVDPPLVVPASAVLWTGTRSVVYVRLPERSEPTYSGREVILGPRAGDYYLVEFGLVEGEQVVTQGNFKIDSALQIEAKPSMMNRPDSAAIPSCFGERLGEVVAAYLPLHRALAGDDDGAAEVAAGRLAAAVSAVDCPDDRLPGAERYAWQQLYAQLERAADQIAQARTIAVRRRALQPLTDNLWTALTRFGYGGADSVRLFHCPMAMDGAGADWIQSDTVTANPYYGAEMLRCGTQTDVLASPAAEPTPGENQPAGHDPGEG